MLPLHRNISLGSQSTLTEVKSMAEVSKMSLKKKIMQIQRCILRKYLSKKQFSFQVKWEKEQIPKNTGLKWPFLFKCWKHVMYKDCWVGATHPEEVKCTPMRRLFKILSTDFNKLLTPAPTWEFCSEVSTVMTAAHPVTEGWRQTGHDKSSVIQRMTEGTMN